MCILFDPCGSPSKYVWIQQRLRKPWFPEPLCRLLSVYLTLTELLACFRSVGERVDLLPSIRPHCVTVKILTITAFGAGAVIGIAIFLSMTAVQEFPDCFEDFHGLTATWSTRGPVPTRATSTQWTSSSRAIQSWTFGPRSSQSFLPKQFQSI